MMQPVALQKTAVLVISGLFFLHYIAFSDVSLSTRFSGSAGYARSCAPLPQPEDRLFGPPLTAERVDEHTLDFEARAYRNYYPDTASLSDAQLRGHYVLFGRKEHRVHQRLRVVLKYAAPAGLANQYYSHVDMLALGLEAGAEVVLADSWKRDGTFNDKYVEHPWPFGWTAVPLSSLHDVDDLIRWARERRAVIHKVPPDLSGDTVEISFNGAAGGICCSKPMAELLYLLRHWAVSTAMDYMHKHATKELPTVIVNIQRETMMALRTDISHVELVSDISRLLKPAAYLQRLAEKVIAGFPEGSSAAFNGLHLRMEEDSQYIEMLGGVEAAWLAYFRSMEGNSFDANTPVYVASGLLTYLSAADFERQVVTRLMQRQLCSGVLYKEQVLRPEQLEGLHTEALAMLDMLVLSHAHRFTGFHASSFSWYVQEHRCQRGIPATTTTMPQESEMGSEQFLPNTLRVNNYTAMCPG